MSKPITAQWDGESFVPVKHHSKLCDDQFVVGEHYTLTEVEQRSQKSQAHYFACIKDAWLNLPDHLALHFPSPEHLRKAALCRTGYATSINAVCASIADARKFAIQCRKEDHFAIVDISENVVTMWTAESQSYHAMKKERFQKSKDAVLDWISDLIGTDASELGKAA